MAETFVPSSSTPAATKVNVRLEELRSKAENPTTSVDELCEALDDGLEWLLALQRDKDNEIWSHITQKDPSEVYKLWEERVSDIEEAWNHIEDYTSLNEEFEEVGGQKKQSLDAKEKIRMALNDVIKLAEECPEMILVDKLPEPERVIKEIGVPLIAGSPTLQNALQDVQQALLQTNGPKCVTLEGEDCVGKTIIMQHLNNLFYDKPDDEFDVVIFIKVAADEQTDEDLHILQKIAERMKIDVEGYKFDVAGKVRKVLKYKRFLLALDSLRQPSTVGRLCHTLKISNDMRIGSKVVITYHDPLSLEGSVVDSTVIKLKPLSPSEAWEVFRERTSSSKSTDAIGEPDLEQDLLRLMRTWDFLHLILSYPMRIGYEGFLKQWIHDASQIGSRGWLKHILYDESPLRYVQAVVPQDIATEIINGGRVSRVKRLKQEAVIPQDIATDLAVHQLTLTLTPDTDLEKIQNILFSAIDDAEKQTVVKKIQEKFQIQPKFDLKIIDLNMIDDQTQREHELLNRITRLEQRTSAMWRAHTSVEKRHLVIVVDGDGDKKLDPKKVSLPINRDSKNVVVFITAPSSAWQNDYFSINMDLTIKTEDHLLPWELFCKIVGSELLNSSIPIQEIAVQIVEKCGGHLLVISLMAQSLKHVTDVQTWDLALKKLCYPAREAIVNAFLFNIIWANVNSEVKKFRRLRCLMIFIFLDRNMTSDDELFDRWFSENLVDTKEEAKSILQNFMECSLLLQFEDTLGLHNIQLPEDIKIILHALGEDMPENLSEGALEPTISDLQAFSLSYTHMRNLYAVNADPDLKELSLDGCMVETLPKAIFKLQMLETLSLKKCSQLLELPPQIAKLENLKELTLDGCERLEALPREIWELQNLQTLSLKNCSQLLELPPNIAKLDNLKQLMLEGCKRLQTLPQEIWELVNLKTLSLPGTSIFPTSENQELINSDYLPLSSIDHEHSGHGKKAVPSSSSAIIPIGFTLKPKAHGRFEQFEKFCQYIMQLRIQNLEKCDLSGTHITDLPPSLNSPCLRSLLLGNNPNLMKIPSSFFDDVPLLTVLDLSRTGIQELPSSIFKLGKLRELYLKHCELFVELPPDIGELTTLTTLDLEGTLITHLPWKTPKQCNLESLSLSFYNDSSFELFPLGIILRSTHLKVLRIDVNSDNEWWSKTFDNILVRICTLKMLQELDLYIPKVDFTVPIKNSWSNFRFIIGYHKPRMISRVPPAIEAMFKESSRSLKFVNGQDFPDRVKTILSDSRAFFLDRHMTIKNLTQFGLENLKQVQLCILAECNEMVSIVDLDEYEAAPDLDESLCMEILIIFYMKNLRSIINNPIHGNSMFSELKVFALHTCPELTTIFTMHSLRSLVNLEELIVENCPKVCSIISRPSSKPTTDFFLPRLRKISFLFVPELASISNGVCIGRNLEEMELYYCPKLQSLSCAELSSEKLKVLRAEREWWEKLQWSKEAWGQDDGPHKFNQIFSPIDEDDLDILTPLTTCELMTSFNKENDSEETSGMSTEDVQSNEDLTKQVTVPSSKPKYRHEFDQKLDEVIVTIFAKGVRPDYIVVYFEEQMLSVGINIPGEEVYNFQPRLFGKIIRSKCQYDVLPTKIEIRLAKAEPIPWTSLEYPNEIAVLPSGSDEDTRQIQKSYDLRPDLLRLMRTRDFLHLILSYPMRIGYENILEKWIHNASQISLRRGLKHILCDESPLRYVQAVIPHDIATDVINGGRASRENIATDIINGGRASREKPLNQVPQPILLATRLALHQLTLTLTSGTIPCSRRAIEKIQNIRFSAGNDAEKRTVVENIRANSQIRATYGDLEIIDLNQIDDQTQREKPLLNLATRRRSQLVLVVDGDGDKKLDPQKVILPINRDSKNVVVFITAPSSAWQNDYFSINVDLTIKTEDHLLPWELFCKIVGSELLNSSIPIQDIAVQIVEKCGGHLLAISLMAQSLKHVTDVQTWELALKKLCYPAREAIVNAFLFNIIWANVNSEVKKFRRLRFLMIFIFLDRNMTSDDELFDLWLSQNLVETKEEAKSILLNFMECSLLLQFEDTLGRHNIQLPEDIKIILHAMREEMPENLSEGALETTVSDLQVLNLSNTHMRNLYAVNTEGDAKELNLKGSMVETLPVAIFKLHKIEILSLEHCSQLLELPQNIAELKNLKELRLSGCERLEKLPQNVAELENLEELRLSGCERLETLPQEIWELPNLEVCDLSGTHITNLPQSLNFPNLGSLLLGTNLNLMKIPPLFFDGVPLLTVLDLSRTSIHELPSSIFKLKKLRELYLKHCELFVELSPDIGELKTLTTLDLDGTLITHLPKEIEELTNLESLSLSFYNDNSSCAVIPLGVLSKLTKLKVLRIDVNSDNEWWCKHVDDILKEIKGLKMLQALDMYIPRDSFSNPIEKRLSNFRFIIGHHKPRMISRIPPAIEAMFKASSRSLKFVNGGDSHNEVKAILPEAWAFFMDRHMTIERFPNFWRENLWQLRLCILAECNKMQSIVDADDKSLCIQFLTIFYLKNLRSIINRPIYGGPIFRELKLLALHTCPELTTIFTMGSLRSLVSLEELIVEDCPKVSCVISCSSSKPTTDFYLPRLRKLSLLFVPELASISNGVRIGGNLEQMGLYYCPKLQSLSPAELSSKQIKVIRGETEWWKNLKWSEAEWKQKDPSHHFNKIFSPIDEDLDILTQLTKYEPMTSFYKIKDSGELEFSS